MSYETHSKAELVGQYHDADYDARVSRYRIAEEQAKLAALETKMRALHIELSAHLRPDEVEVCRVANHVWVITKEKMQVTHYKTWRSL